MWKTWFFDGERNLMDELIEIVKGYDFKQRFISHEKVNGKGEVKPHFHILCEMENVKPWNSMTAHLIRIYKLKEKNKELNKDHKGSGGYRCYGASDKDVYTPEKFTRYIAKDGDIWGDIPASELEKIIKEVNKQGTKVIAVTHDLLQARRLAHDIIFINKGKVCEFTGAKIFFSKPKSKEGKLFMAGKLIV